MGNNQPKGLDLARANQLSNQLFSKHFGNVNQGHEKNYVAEVKKEPVEHNEFISKLGQILEERSYKEGSSEGISRKIFQKYICNMNEDLGYKLFTYFLNKEGILKQSSEKENMVLPLEGFIKQSSKLLDCISDSQQLEYYIKVFANGKEEMSYNEIYLLIKASYETTQFDQLTSFSPHDPLKALTKTIIHGKECITCKYIHNWLCQHCPRMVMGMHKYIRHMLTIGYSMLSQDVDTEQSPCYSPELGSPSKTLCSSLHPALVWMLSCTLPYLYTKSDFLSISEESWTVLKPSRLLQKLVNASDLSHWSLLFNSNEHGFSVNRFQHHVFDYRGPTLLFITADDGSLFCVASDVEWKDSKNFYGGSESMCLQLHPEYKIIERGANILYFNTTWRGFPEGLQVGSDYKNRAICIDGKLEFVHFKKIPFKLKSLEVWGCGASKIKEVQLEFKNQAKKDAENRRKVKLETPSWKENPDRYLLEMAGTKESYVQYD